MTFTNKLPTRPGAYWFKLFDASIPRVIEVTDPHNDGVLGTLWCGTEWALTRLGGLYSERLVPENGDE